MSAYVRGRLLAGARLISSFCAADFAGVASVRATSVRAASRATSGRATSRATPARTTSRATSGRATSRATPAWESRVACAECLDGAMTTEGGRSQVFRDRHPDMARPCIHTRAHAHTRIALWFLPLFLHSKAGRVF